MNKKDKIKLSAISNIDDKYIDESTKTRIKLYAKLKKKKRSRVGVIVAFAAAIAIIMSLALAVMLPMLLGGIGKQVPVYTGMTVSGAVTPDVALAAPEDHVAVIKNDNGVRIIPLSGENRALALYRSRHGKLDHEKPFDDGKNDIVDRIDDVLSVVGVGEEIYYAKANEDVYITVHVDNPDDFEILSFTLNKKTYASYMFEEGSDMENLILKYNVGDTYGVVEYTLDEIKYVDGTEIKDVILRGDRTVKVGIYTPDQPTAAVKNMNVGLGSVSFDLDLSDGKGILAMSDGKVQAVLFDGEKVVAQKDVNVGEDISVTFDGLTHNTLYQLSVIAKYDALDGNGVDSYALYQEAFYTPMALEINGGEITQTGVSFAYAWNSGAVNGSLQSAVLYKGDEKVRDIDTTATSVDGLLSNTSHTLLVKYAFGEFTDTVEYNFTTKAKSEPTYAIVDTDSTKSEITFGITETDADNIGTVTKIELIRGNDEPISVAVGETAKFENLLSNNNYTAKVTYTYDLNDGTGVQTKTVTRNIKTKAKSAPNYAIVDVTKTQTQVDFKITENDVDNIGTVTKVEMFKDGEMPIVGVVGENVTFTGLSSATVYTIKVTYEYDLNDGTGTHTKTITKKVATKARDVSVTGITVNGGQKSVNVGESVLLIVTVNNPDNVSIKTLTINGVTCKADEFGNAYAVEYYSTSEGGKEYFNCTSVGYEIAGETFSNNSDYTSISSIVVIGTVSVVEIVPENGRYIYQSGEDVKMLVTFKGSEAYELKKLDSYVLTKVSDTVYSFIIKGRISKDYEAPAGYLSKEAMLGVFSVGNIECTLEGETLNIDLDYITDLGIIWKIPMTNVIEVSTATQLQAINGSGHYKLVNDIDLSALGNWTPIKSFSGILDGNGYTIKNLSVTQLGTDAAMFLDLSGTVRNLNFENASVYCYNKSEYYGKAAIIASTFYGRIYNCTVEGTVTYVTDMKHDSDCVAAFVGGASDSQVIGCTFIGEINYRDCNHAIYGAFVSYDSSDTKTIRCEAYIGGENSIDTTYQGLGCKNYPLSEAPKKD